MRFLILFFCIYIIYKLYLVFIEVKNASLKNKSIFINEFKNNGYMNHDYTINNYNQIKAYVESMYPQIEYIKSQDLFYASVIFKTSKNSKEYRQAIKYKEDISKIYNQIEFDILKECFKQIIKIEQFIDSNSNIEDEVFDKNKKLFKALTNDLFFSKKVSQCTIALSISTIFTAILSIFIIFSIPKSRVI